MAVIPSGTSEPWVWAAREAQANDALARLFVQENMRREMQQNQFGENARNRDFRAGQQDKQLTWQGEKLNQQQQFTAGENQANRENAWNIAQYRTDNRVTGAGKGAKYQIVYDDDVLQAWNAIEQKYKLPQGYLASIVGPESSGGANTVSGVSSAKGPFQFIDRTAKQYGLDTPGKRFDPIVSAEAAARYAVDNRNAAAALGGGAIRWTGGPQDIGKLYLLHQQGAEGGYRLLLPANATRQAFSVGHPANLMSNGVTSSMSAQDVINKWEQKMAPWYSSYATRMTKIGGGAPPAPQQAAQAPNMSTQLNAPNTGQPSVSVPASSPPPTGAAPPLATQSAPATNPSQPATASQPQPFQTQPQLGRGSVPPSTISPQVVPQPPATVAGAPSGAANASPLTGGSGAAPSPSDVYTAPDGSQYPNVVPKLPKTVDTSTQTTDVTGAPAGALGDRGTPSLPGGAPAPGTRKRVTKYVDENGVLRFSHPQ